MDTPLFFSNAETCDSSRKLAEENYQRELLLHAEDTKRVVLTSEELEKVKKERNEAERKATSVATEFAESARSWETSKSMLVREREEGEERMKDMSVQNNLLHAQLENVTTKVQQLEEARGTDRRNILESSLVVPSNSDSNGDDAATSSDSSSSTTATTTFSSSSSSSLLSSSLSSSLSSAVSTSESQLVSVPKMLF